jgi:hypothetical protein
MFVPFSADAAPASQLRYLLLSGAGQPLSLTLQRCSMRHVATQLFLQLDLAFSALPFRNQFERRLPAVHSHNIIRLRTMSLGHCRIAYSSCLDGSFDGFLQCGRGAASALTFCWNLLSCAINSRCCSEQAHTASMLQPE